MKYFKTIASLAITVGLCYALNRGWGSAPAFGRFLSPFTGFWVNGEKPLSDKPLEGSLQLIGLQDEVTVEYDELGIPHIFANNDHDLYMAQGYVTAKDRLWHKAKLSEE